MHAVALSRDDDFDGWRAAARRLALAAVPPGEIAWCVGDQPSDLFGTDAVIPAPLSGLGVPRAFLDLAETAILHRAPERFGLLYRLLFALCGRARLLEDHADPLVRQAESMAKSVRRDMHKMRAFVRFREVADENGPRFVAWFEPDHHIVRANAGFFVRRFSTMHWSILTPELSIHWDGERLTETPGARRDDAPSGDTIEALWSSYYASIFNPARVKIGMMTREMPRRYWKNMPETALIPQLTATAQSRESAMVTMSRTAPVGGSDNVKAWKALRTEASACTRCPLHRCATQTVFGEGPVDAAIMLVGEQPGDQEDLAGRPFVGPAGKLLDRALADAALDRRVTYVTNAVKHFKFEQRGKRRLHSKPNAGEIQACRWWYEQERLLIRPAMTVALGATAARSVLGKPATVASVRGRTLTLPEGGLARVTIHPSYLLRLTDKAQAAEEYARFVEDLRAACNAVD